MFDQFLKILFYLFFFTSRHLVWVSRVIPKEVSLGKNIKVKRETEKETCKEAEQDRSEAFGLTILRMRAGIKSNTGFLSL